MVFFVDFTLLISINTQETGWTGVTGWTVSGGTFTSRCLSCSGGVTLCKLQYNILCFFSSLISVWLCKQEKYVGVSAPWEAWSGLVESHRIKRIEKNAQSAVLKQTGAAERIAQRCWWVNYLTGSSDYIVLYIFSCVCFVR